MIGHFEDGYLQAWLDEELSREAAEEISLHLLECGPCRNRVEELRTLSARVSGHLSPLDPVVDVEAAMWQLHQRRSKRRSSAPRRWNAAAALLVFFMTAAGAAAFPGSPIRSWIANRGEPAGDAFTNPAQPESVGPSGIAVLPVAGEVEAILRSVPGGGEVRIQIADVDALELETAATARYTTAPGRIETVIDEDPPASILIRVPSSAREFRLVLEDRTLLRWSEGNFIPDDGIQNEADEGMGTFLLRIPPALLEAESADR